MRGWWRSWRFKLRKSLSGLKVFETNLTVGMPTGRWRIRSNRSSLHQQGFVKEFQAGKRSGNYFRRLPGTCHRGANDPVKFDAQPLEVVCREGDLLLAHLGQIPFGIVSSVQVVLAVTDEDQISGASSFCLVAWTEINVWCVKAPKIFQIAQMSNEIFQAPKYLLVPIVIPFATFGYILFAVGSLQ